MAEDEKDLNSQSKTKSTLIIIANTILAILILVGAAVGFSLLPLKNNYKMLSVMSGSMAPTIPTGSLIIVKPRLSYQVGDVITFRSPKSNVSDKDLTTHRIYSIENTEENKKIYVTKGDANKQPDFERVDPSRVVGKEIFKVKYLGYLLGYIKTLPGLIIIIIIPAAIIIYEETKKIFHEIRNIRKKKPKPKEQNEKSKKKTIVDITVDKG